MAQELYDKADKKHAEILNAILNSASEKEALRYILDKMESGEDISVSAFNISFRVNDGSHSICEEMEFSNFSRFQLDRYGREFETL